MKFFKKSEAACPLYMILDIFFKVDGLNTWWATLEVHVF